MGDRASAGATCSIRRPAAGLIEKPGGAAGPGDGLNHVGPIVRQFAKTTEGSRIYNLCERVRMRAVGAMSHACVGMLSGD